jgi:hypothetical protein
MLYASPAFRIPYSVFRVPYSVFRLPQSAIPDSRFLFVICHLSSVMRFAERNAPLCGAAADLNGHFWLRIDQAHVRRRPSEYPQQ